MLARLKAKIRSFLGILSLTEEVESLKNEIREIKSYIAEYNSLKSFVLQIPEGANLAGRLNRVDGLIPVEILKNYIHCFRCLGEAKIDVLVETHCSDWLAQHLRPGDTALDVGAAFGVIALPLARAVGPKGKVYAFEPARKTQAILRRLIEANGLNNIHLVPQAIGEETGSAEFIEYSSDNNFSWAPDTSTLATGVEPAMDRYTKYAVEVTTIDRFVEDHHLQPKAIKMDIEGFEYYALQGAVNTLKTHHPALCIDIHADVKSKESALATVEPFLTQLGYHCDYRQHTLFAVYSPN